MSHGTSKKRAIPVDANGVPLGLRTIPGGDRALAVKDVKALDLLSQVYAELVDFITPRKPLVIDPLTLDDITLPDEIPYYNLALKTNRKTTAERLGGLLRPATCEGRLTLTSGVPVTVSDVVAATTIYFTPYYGNRISLFDGTRWLLRSFSETALPLSGLTAGLNYDLFAYDASGTVALARAAWSTDTARVTGLVLKDGVLSLGSDLTRRYLGTFRATGTGFADDSISHRYLWNACNRRLRPLRVSSTSSHTYNTGTTQPWNNSTTNRVEFVTGEDGSCVPTSIYGAVTPDVAGHFGQIGYGLDSITTEYVALPISRNANLTTVGGADAVGPLAAGYHFLQALEKGDAAGAATFSNFYLSAVLEG